MKKHRWVYPCELIHQYVRNSIYCTPNAHRCESTKPTYFRTYSSVSTNYGYNEKFVNISYVSYLFLVCVRAERSAMRTVCGFCFFLLDFLFFCFYFDRGEYIRTTHIYDVPMCCVSGATLCLSVLSARWHTFIPPARFRLIPIDGIIVCADGQDMWKCSSHLNFNGIIRTKSTLPLWINVAVLEYVMLCYKLHKEGIQNIGTFSWMELNTCDKMEIFDAIKSSKCTFLDYLFRFFCCFFS